MQSGESECGLQNTTWLSHPIWKTDHSRTTSQVNTREREFRGSPELEKYTTTTTTTTGYTSGQSNFKSYIFFHPTHFQSPDLLFRRKFSTCGFRIKLITVICFRVRLDGTHLITGWCIYEFAHSFLQTWAVKFIGWGLHFTWIVH